MCALFLSEVCDGDVLLDNTFKLLGPDGLDQSWYLQWAEEVAWKAKEVLMKSKALFSFRV